MTFDEFQAAAVNVSASLRNNRDRIHLPVTGLQQEAGRIGSLLTTALASGRLNLTPEQIEEIKKRMADVLWFSALLCYETGISFQDVAVHSVAQVQARATRIDSDQR